MKINKNYLITAIVLIVFSVGFLLWLNRAFNTSELVRDIFCVSAQEEVVGQVAPDSPESFASRSLMAGKISMFIFAVITILQAVALGVALAVIHSIRATAESAALKLKKLENADIFFDTPLYIGLFGTVSAFLVMTFSPHSSRLIAYSSTLIGIIFSLILRIALLYPLRQKLLGEQDKSLTEGAGK